MTTPTFEVQVIEMLNDLSRKMVRIETRVLRLAEELSIDVKHERKEKKHESVQ